MICLNNFCDLEHTLEENDRMTLCAGSTALKEQHLKQSCKQSEWQMASAVYF